MSTAALPVYCATIALYYCATLNYWSLKMFRASMLIKLRKENWQYCQLGGFEGSDSLT